MMAKAEDTTSNVIELATGGAAAAPPGAEAGQHGQEGASGDDLDATAGAAAEGAGTEEHPEGAEGAASAGDDDEIVVSIGEASPASDEDENRAPEWVRELRKSNREKDRLLREQAQEIERLKGATPGQPAAAALQVGEKPTLEGCNFDAAKFEADLESWHARKRAADDARAEAEAAQKKERDAWQAKLDGYTRERNALKVTDKDEAEAVVRETLSVIQQGILINGAEKPALLVVALGKNPAKAKELAAISDPVKFAFAAAKLETQLKVTPRKSVPAPERVIRSSVPGAAAVDNQLERLRAEAAKTGDLSKVLAYKRQKAGAGRG